MTRKSSKGRSPRPQVSKRELRSQIAKLKKLGAISPKVNAATVKLTKYRKRQVSALQSILTGEADFVKLPKADRDAYARTTSTRKFGSLLLIPKEAPDQQTDIVQRGGRNLVRIRTPLGRGEISQIILPYDVSNLIQLATAIQNDDELPEELFEMHPTDQYAFALFGHTAKIGFPTKQELTDYILVNYKHLFSGGSGEKAVKHFVLVNYGGGSGQPPEIPESIAGPKYESEIGHGRNPKINAKGRTDWFENRKRQTENEKKKTIRRKIKNYNPAQYERDKAAARDRAAKSYAEKQKREFKNARFET